MWLQITRDHIPEDDSCYWVLLQVSFIRTGCRCNSTRHQTISALFWWPSRNGRESDFITYLFCLMLQIRRTWKHSPRFQNLSGSDRPNLVCQHSGNKKKKPKLKGFFFCASAIKRCKKPRFRETLNGFSCLSALFNDEINSKYYIASAIDEWMNEHGTLTERCWQRAIEVFGENPVLMPLFLPQIPHEMAWDWTWISKVRGRQLTACAVARTKGFSYKNGY